MRNILVTGGTGFLGANLVHDLVKAGHAVHVLIRPGSNRWRLAHLEPRLEFHTGDMLDRHSLRRVVDACQPQVIYHLATYGVLASQKDRDAILAGNVQATANLLAALEGHDYERLVQAGSSAEYGASLEPLREDGRLEPRTDYGIAKACATLLCQAEKYKGRPVTTVRIFTAFGPWESLPRLVPYVMDCCRTGQSPRLTSGSQERDFIHVQDVVDLLQLAAIHPGARGQILHAATGKQTSVRAVVETIIALSGEHIVPIFGAQARLEGEPDRWQASIELTTALTGWRPKFDLRAGLEQVWAWHAAHQRAAA